MASVAKREWEYKGEKRVSWVVRYTDQAGKKRLKTFESKKNADSFRNKISFNLERGEHIAPTGDMKFNDVIESFLRHCEARVAVDDGLRASTLRSWRRVIKSSIQPKFGNYKLRDVTLREVQKWLDAAGLDRAKPIKRAGIRTRLMILRLMFQYAAKNGLCRNALKGEDMELHGAMSEEIPVPTRDEVRQLLLASDTREKTRGGSPPYRKALIYTAIFSGLRAGELRALTWNHINFKDGIIEVRQAADDLGVICKPKSSAGIRDVPMAPPLLKVLREWRLAAPIGRYVFSPTKPAPVWMKDRAAKGELLSHSTIHTVWLTLQRRVFGESTSRTATGLKRPARRYHFHSLRHVAAAVFIESGLPPKRIQVIMGHTSIKLTFDLYGYLFEDPNLVRKSMEQIESRWAL